MITTIEDAYAFVREVKICTIFAQNTVHASLWEQVDLPDRQPGEKGRGQKVTAVWRWKNELPALYPDEIFYGKIRGGYAVLMEMAYLRDEHFPTAYQPVERLSRLAQLTYEQVRLEPGETAAPQKSGRFRVWRNQESVRYGVERVADVAECGAFKWSACGAGYMGDV